jgi:cytochrome P450
MRLAMTAETVSSAVIPDDIARNVILPRSYTDENAYSFPALKWLRQNNPFGIAHVDGYEPLWLATKHADIIDIELNPEVFASGLDEPGINDKASSDFLKFMRGDNRTLDTLAYMDAPDHAKVKAVTNEWFMPASIRKREEMIRALAKQSVERVLSFDGEVDFVKDFALHYPLRVIMTLLGVPPEDEPLMLRLTQEMFGAADPEDQQKEGFAADPEAQAKMWRASIQGFYDYFDVLSEDRRKNPRDDLVSLVANAKIDGEYLPNSYMNGTTWLLRRRDTIQPRRRSPGP